MTVKPQPATSFKEVLERFPAPALRTIADSLPAPYNTVCAWKRRNFVPPPYWEGLAAAAKRLHVPGVDVGVLRTIGEAIAIDRLAGLQRRRAALDRAASRRAHA